jgi:hypothetical protein
MLVPSTGWYARRLSIKLARERRELEITPTGVRWAGPTDPELDAPIVACELTVALEPRGLAELVERAPIPSVLLHELAARCPPGDDEGADPRWRRARAAVAIARGDAVGEVRDEIGTCIDRDVDAMRRLPDGTLVRPRGTELAIGDAPPIALPVVERASYGLPTPLAPDTIDPGQVIVTIQSYQPGHLILLAFDGAGRELARAEGPSNERPAQVSHGAAGYWVHGDRHHALVGQPTPTTGRPYMGSGAPVSARWLFALHGEIVWVSLDTAERRTFEWPQELRALVRVDDVLWATTREGLWRLRGGEAPVRVWSGDAYGVAVDETRAWLALHGQATVVAIELATGSELWRTKLAHQAYALYRFDNAIVASSISCFTCLAPDGRILAATDERRDLGIARLADGTIAASAGEQVVIVDPAGNVRRALPMPYDGQIVGATADRFLFGPVSGGVDRVRPTALVAFDHTGRVTAQLVPPCRPVCIDDGRVYVIDHPARELRAWDPRGTASGVVPPPPRLPTERGARRVGAQVINPRDDWPEVGIEVHADFLALEGTYGGSTGQASEVALRVGDGAIATFVRCDLTIGRDGSIAERGSTVFLIDCKLPDRTWSIGSACHLVILGGQVAGRLHIDAAPTATVTVDGLLARRAGNVWLVTSIAMGTRVEVGGVTYAWERDDRSGPIGYRSGGTIGSYIHITGDDGTSISFEPPNAGVQSPGWWRGTGHASPDVIERALEIVARRGSPPPHMLTSDEVAEAFDGGRTVQDSLAAARAALDGLTRPEGTDTRAGFIRCLLAAGCREAESDREAIADWVASHADALVAARAGLQLLVGELRAFESRLGTRSAIAFLIDMCARMNVELGLDTSTEDAALAHYRLKGPRPWGIPASHWWWGNEPEPATPTSSGDDEELHPLFR